MEKKSGIHFIIGWFLLSSLILASGIYLGIKTQTLNEKVIVYQEWDKISEEINKNLESLNLNYDKIMDDPKNEKTLGTLERKIKSHDLLINEARLFLLTHKGILEKQNLISDQLNIHESFNLKLKELAENVKNGNDIPILRFTLNKDGTLTQDK